MDFSIFNTEFLNETIGNYLWCAAIILFTLVLKKPIAAQLTRLSSTLAVKFNYSWHKAAITDMLFKPMERLLQSVLYYLAANQISGFLNGIDIGKHFYIGKKVVVDFSLGTLTDHIFLFVFIIFLTRFLTSFADFLYYLRMEKANSDRNHSQQQLLPLVREISKLAVWTIATFAILGFVFHVNVPALITGLGIGGVAIALAGKETVENFFAAFTLLSDKPFVTGDIIKTGDIEGVVERIGFRSTHIRNFNGASIIVPNQHLVSQSLINSSDRNIRGMKVVANLRYGIDAEKLKDLIEAIKVSVAGYAPVQGAVTAIVEVFDKETMQLVVEYNLPHPLPQGTDLMTVKQMIHLLVYSKLTEFAELGVPPVQGGQVLPVETKH